MCTHGYAESAPAARPGAPQPGYLFSRLRLYSTVRLPHNSRHRYSVSPHLFYVLQYDYNQYGLLTPYNTINKNCLGKGGSRAWLGSVAPTHQPHSASHLTRESPTWTEGEARLVQHALLAWNVRSGLARPAATRASARAWSSWIGPRASRAGVAAPAAHGSPATARCGRRPSSCPPRAGSASACASARKSAAATGPASHARGQGG